MPSCNSTRTVLALSKPDFDRHLREPGAAVYGRRNHWLIPHVDPVLTLLLLILMGAGLLVLYSASGKDLGQVQRQMLFMGGGLAAMAFAAQIPPRVPQRWAWSALCFGHIAAGGRAGAQAQGSGSTRTTISLTGPKVPAVSRSRAAKIVV